MSYILDALKKSERERKRGTVPDILTVQESMQQPTSKKPLWPIFVVAALSLSVALLVWWFAPWKADTRRTAVESPVHTQPQGGVRFETSPVSGKEELSAPQVQAEDMHTDSPKAPAAGGKGVITLPAPRAGRLPDTQPEPGPPARESVKTIKAEVNGDVRPSEQSAVALPPAENRIYLLKELPEPLRKTLPGFSITAFLYSATPSARMVQINGLMLREGEDLSPGLRLEEITPDGVIMSCRTYRFSVGVQ